MKYTRIEKPPMLLAGYTVRASAQNPEIIEQLWELFLATWQQVDYANHQTFYVIQAPTEVITQFDYTLAIEVESFGELPTGMDYLDLAAMEYAAFQGSDFSGEVDLYQVIEETLQAEQVEFLTDYTLECYPSKNLAQVQVLVPLGETAENQ